MAFSRLTKKLCRSILIALFVSSLWLPQTQSAVVSNLNTCKPCFKASQDPATLTLVARNDLIEKKSCCTLNVKREFDDSQTVKQFLLSDDCETYSSNKAQQMNVQTNITDPIVSNRQKVSTGVVASLKRIIKFAKAIYHQENSIDLAVARSLFSSVYCKPFMT